jgi:hypothetical protein
MREAVEAARDAIADALGMVDGLSGRVHVGAFPQLHPPAAVVGPASFLWEAYDTDPTTAAISVAIVVRADAEAISTLYGLVPAAANAIHENVVTAVVRSASPLSYQSGGQDLPAYELRVEVALSYD